MCARTQFMTDSFLWAECPIMSKTNETMKHNAEVAQFRFALIAPVIQGLFPDASATAYYKRVISAICASMDEDIYVFSNSIILFSPFYLFYFSTIFKLKANFFKAFSYTCLVPFGTYTTLPSDGKYAAPFLFGGIFD